MDSWWNRGSTGCCNRLDMQVNKNHMIQYTLLTCDRTGAGTGAAAVAVVVVATEAPLSPTRLKASSISG